MTATGDKGKHASTPRQCPLTGRRSGRGRRCAASPVGPRAGPALSRLCASPWETPREGDRTRFSVKPSFTRTQCAGDPVWPHAHSCVLEEAGWVDIHCSGEEMFLLCVLRQWGGGGDPVWGEREQRGREPTKTRVWGSGPDRHCGYSSRTGGLGGVGPEEPQATNRKTEAECDGDRGHPAGAHGHGRRCPAVPALARGPAPEATRRAPGALPRAAARRGRGTLKTEQLMKMKKLKLTEILIPASPYDTSEDGTR